MSKQKRLDELTNEFFNYVESNIDDANKRFDLWAFMDRFEEIANE